MTQLLVASDVHANAAHVTTLLALAKRRGCTRVVQLGDFGFWEHTEWGRDFLAAVERAAGRVGIVVHAIDGNHDKTSLVLARHPERDDEGFHVVSDHIRYVPRGHRWTWDGTRFAAFGGACSLDKAGRLRKEALTGWPESLWFPEEEMTDGELKQMLVADPSPVDVMFSHDKPRSSDPRWGRADIPETWPNQDRIQRAMRALRPKLLMHGHLHFRYSDRVRCGDNAWTLVEGLDAGAVPGHTFDKRDSRALLTLPYEVPSVIPGLEPDGRRQQEPAIPARSRQGSRSGRPGTSG